MNRSTVPPLGVRLLGVPLLGAALVLGLASCAGGPPPDRDAEGGPHGPGAHRLPNTFISPAGKPFRARFDEPYPVAVWFAAADADHNGRLTRAEFRADALAFFRELDSNHDGVIDGFEVANYEQNVAPEILPHIEGLHADEGMDPGLDLGDIHNTGRDHGEQRGRGGRPRAARPQAGRSEPTQGAAVFSLINAPEPVAAADTQFDSRITQAEFTAAADKRFDLLDGKQLGYLTLATLPKTPIQVAITQVAARAARLHATDHATRDRTQAGASPTPADGEPAPSEKPPPPHAP